MNLDIPKIIKEHHEMMIDKGFFECPECKNPIVTCEGAGQCDCDGANCTVDDNCGEYEPRCKNCKGTGIDLNKNIGEMIMQIVSEIGEAYEAHRNGRFCDTMMYDWKDCFEYELADIFLSIFNLCGYLRLTPICLSLHLSESKNIGESFFKITRILTDTDYSQKGLLHSLSVTLYLLDMMCSDIKIDIEKHILAKMQYNKTRPYKHGKEY